MKLVDTFSNQRNAWTTTCTTMVLSKLMMGNFRIVSLLSVIVRVSIVLKRTVVVDND